MKTEHVLALSDAIDPRFRAAIWIGAGAGLRGSEVLALTPERIEWLPGASIVEAQIQTPVGREPFEKEPKNGSRRLVPVGEVVLEEPSRHLESLGGPSYEGYLFTNRAKAVRRSRFMEVFKRAVVASGVPSGTTFHDLRHY
jgi:integrase